MELKHNYDRRLVANTLHTTSELQGDFITPREALAIARTYLDFIVDEIGEHESDEAQTMTLSILNALLHVKDVSIGFQYFDQKKSCNAWLDEGI